MGQYHLTLNLDKKEFLNPHHCGDGLKLLEFGCGGSTMTALAVLLSTSNGLGGGDLRTEDKTWVGRWAGDRIAVVGDYDEHSPHAGLYRKASDGEDGWKDVSFDVMRVLAEDAYLAEDMAKNTWMHGLWKEAGQELPPQMKAAMTRLKKETKKVAQPA
jgi:hypothetical protein